MHVRLLSGILVYFLISKSLAVRYVNGTANRVYKGVAAIDGQFPFIVFIIPGIYLGPNSRSSICTGSLIKFDVVLTAAHCLHNEEPYFVYQPKNIVVMAGKVDGTDYYTFRIRNPMTVKYTTPPPETHQEALALRTFIHPVYKSNDFYDVGIIKLTKPFVKTKYVDIIAYSTDEFPGRGTCHFIGFGETHLGSDRKLNYFTTQKAKNNLNQCGIDHDVSIIYCIEKNRRSDPCGCEGDSGSPLVCNSKVYGVYFVDIYYAEEHDEEICGDLLVNIIAKLSTSEKDHKFVTLYAANMTSNSCNVVSNLYSLIPIFLLFL